MKLETFYGKAIEIGMARDMRGESEVRKLLVEENERFGKLPPDEAEFFDRDKLFNPFPDTRVLFGALETEVRKVIVGIDMEGGEVLLTYLLNRDRKAGIDLVVAHHPEGRALAQLHEVMRLQADLLASCGISMSVAEQLMEKRMGEIERRLLPVNHNRAVDTARALGIPMICVHTPADNCVARYLTELFKTSRPLRLKDLLKTLRDIPEYRKAGMTLVSPRVVSGADSNRCGRIFVDMTGGTEGAKEIFAKHAAAGVSTLVGMHFSEEAVEEAKKANLNLVVAGHIASDTLGLNLLFDELEKVERLEFVGVSGFERIRRRSRGQARRQPQ